jgi:dTDP-4-amino-4,6-dideoxygalactose transaminase
VGARLVYCDVDPVTLLVTSEGLGRVIGPDTKAVVVTHLYGNVADMRPIVELCQRRGIRLIEDCAQVIGGIDRAGRRAGTVGDVATFSFYPTKNLGAAGDAGAVVSNDDRIDARARSLRQYGWSTKYRVAESEGRNSRLDEMQAAILRIGLPRVDALNERRRAIVRRYAEAARGSDVSMATGAGCETVAHLAVVRCRERDRLRRFLSEAGIDTDIHYPIPDHQQPGFAPPVRSSSMIETERAAAEILTLPCFAEMTDGEIEHVAEAIASFHVSGIS